MVDKFNVVWFVLTFLFCTTGSAIILTYFNERSLLWLFGLTLFGMTALWCLAHRKRRRKK